jgi:hypothetical protein
MDKPRVLYPRDLRASGQQSSKLRARPKHALSSTRTTSCTHTYTPFTFPFILFLCVYYQHLFVHSPPQVSQKSQSQPCPGAAQAPIVSDTLGTANPSSRGLSRPFRFRQRLFPLPPTISNKIQSKSPHSFDLVLIDPSPETKS